MIFERFVNDRWSYKRIAEELNSKNALTAFGNKWSSKSSFIDILKNKRYIGILEYGRSYINPVTKKRNQHKSNENVLIQENALPAIIDKDLFNKAQEILKYRKQNASKFKAKESYMLSGLIYCKDCGAPYSGNTRMNKAKTSSCSTYRCSNKTRKVGVKCKSREILKANLENYVLLQVKYLLTKPESIDKLISMINESMDNSQKSSINELSVLKQRRKKNDLSIKNIKKIIKQYPENVSTSLMDELTALEESNRNIDIETNEINTNVDCLKLTRDEFINSLDTVLVRLSSSNSEILKEALREIINRILISNQSIEIEFNLNAFSLTKRIRTSRLYSVIERNLVNTHKGKIYTQTELHIFSIERTIDKKLGLQLKQIHITI